MWPDFVSDIFDQQCCQIDCYILRDCKLSTSSHCTSSPVECAMGDAYRYTIQPVFQNLKKEFQCHIKHKKPTALYTMFFHIKVRILVLHRGSSFYARSCSASGHSNPVEHKKTSNSNLSKCSADMVCAKQRGNLNLECRGARSFVVKNPLAHVSLLGEKTSWYCSPTQLYGNGKSTCMAAPKFPNWQKSAG